MGNCICANPPDPMPTPGEPSLSDKRLAARLPLAAWFDNPRFKQMRESGDYETELLCLLIKARKNLRRKRRVVRSVFAAWFHELDGRRTKEIQEEIFVYLVLAPDFTLLTRRGEQVFDRERRIPTKILWYFEQQMDEYTNGRNEEDDDNVPSGAVGPSRMIVGLAFGDFDLIKLGKGLSL